MGSDATLWRNSTWMSAVLLTVVLGIIATSSNCLAATTPVKAAREPLQLSAPATPPQVLSAAASGAAAGASQQVLVQLQNQLRAAADDKTLAAISVQASELQSRAQRSVASINAELASLDGTMRQLPARGHSPAAEAQRSRLAEQTAKREQLQTHLREARAFETGANAIFKEVAERRREGFSARVLEQSPSPLEPGFWAGLIAQIGPDLDRVADLGADAFSTARAAPEPRAGLSLAFGLVLALVLLMPVRRGLEGLAGRASGFGLSSSFRQTLQAALLTVIDIGLPVLAAVALRLSASWGGLLSEDASALSQAGVVAAGWAAAVLALGRALVTDRDPTRRLLTVPDSVARRAQGPLRLVAMITAAGYLLSRLNYIVGASVAATIATNCVLSLAYAAVTAAILASTSAGGKPAGEGDGASPSAASPVWTLVAVALGLAVIATCASVLTGFTTLAVLISGQVFWLSVLGALTFLVLRFIDNLCSALFAPEAWAGRVLAGVFGLRRATVAQTGILLSAGLQVIVLIGAATLALTPFGDSGRLLAEHVHQLGNVVRIGSATISPTAVVSGLIVLAVGLALAHLVRGWVVRRYLPVTDWDAGVRNSVGTGVSYLGVGLAIISALAAMGLGFRQIALIASALSVGIGFGLQQVVQNFVSGLILLIERPVKVGDWVNVGGVEGDIRRIRVRATEIQTFDRTTVIVPNSDLITKQVLNKTLGDPRGRVQLDISIANGADTSLAAATILSVAEGLADVLKDPKPAVYVDSIGEGGGVNFKVYLFVRTPRDATKARSEAYSGVLCAFQKAGIPFMGAAAPQVVVVEPGDSLKRRLDCIGPPPPTDAAEARARTST